MVEHTQMAINAAIDAYMLAEKATYSQVCGRLGISAASLANKRKGVTDWKWSEILALSEMMGLTPDELAGLCA